MDFEHIRHKMSLSEDSVEYIKNIIKQNNLKNILEIGCFNGYSAMHFSQVSKKVMTIETNKEFVKLAKENFKEFNCKNIEVIEGDAKKVMKNLNEKFDLIFIDGKKIEYREYLKLSLNLIDKGFIFLDNTLCFTLRNNVVSSKEHLKDFFEYLENSGLKWKESGLGKGLIEVKI